MMGEVQGAQGEPRGEGEVAGINISYLTTLKDGQITLD